jgi:two-component system sensor histidine kinase/response regulator
VRFGIEPELTLIRLVRARRVFRRSAGLLGAGSQASFTLGQGRCSAKHRASATLSAVSKRSISDLDAALNALEGDRELLRRIAQLFLAQCPQLLGEVREALSRGDADALERAAHKLRGSVSNFAAKKAHDAALRLEQMGRDRDLSGGAEAQADLESALRELQGTLSDFSKDGHR